MENELTTAPTFTFKQGKHSDGSFEENPIQIEFYNGAIVLRQEGAFDLDESISISPKYLDKLFKAIKKNLPEATDWLNRQK